MEYVEQFQKLEDSLRTHNPDVDLAMLEKRSPLPTKNINSKNENPANRLSSIPWL